MIKFISEDGLLEIKNNRSLLYSNVIASKKQTLEEAFHNDRIIRDTSVPVDEFQLDMSAEKPELTDFENVKRVHKNMRALSESQASDERIWAAYTLSVFADYTRVKILSALAISELCVTDLSRILNINQTTVSHQLRFLKSAGIVKCIRQGKIIFYSLTDDSINDVILKGIEFLGC